MTAVAVTHRPGQLRATLTGPVLSEDVVLALASALERAEHTPRVRAFVIAADGPAFCTGMPLTGDRSTSDILGGLGAAHDLMTGLAHSPLATVALVDGQVTGGGIAVVAACDQVVAGPGATFRITESLVGLLPALLLPVVARRTGHQRAFSLALTAHQLDATAAVDAGLADRATPDPEAELTRIMRELGRTTPATVAALKRYRAALQPENGSLDRATAALRERLDDPDSRARLTLLARQGLLP
ncbi:enoyl-CoA hydratase/isomerase family protein [Streptomyces sp. NPDC091279]|uniref:enoyl-CoA hydratase/isomerase family protein n=1 Tax=unclassified Streptomyces TaxID=2593676 RepID=UPI0037F9804C